nr:serine--tRNA ligase [Cytophagaceae bacterium]
MLQLSQLREQKDLVLAGLAKKHVKQAEEQVETILSMDQFRRDTQRELDLLLAESNSISKEIGNLMKSGKKEEAENLKHKTGVLKEKSKELQDKLTQSETDLQQLLVKLPNLPHTSVPEGRSAEDNKEVFTWGQIPHLPADAVPHWDL